MNEKDIIWDNEVNWDKSQPTQQPQLQQKQPVALPNSSIVEQKISERKNPIQELLKELRYAPNPLKKPLDFILHPAVTTLKALAVPYGIAESTLASTGLNAQKGELFSTKTGKDLLNSLMGKRQAQLGDIIRTTGFGGMFNEPMASSVGLISAMAIGGLQGKATKVEQTVSREVAEQATDLGGKVVNTLIKPSHKNFLFGKNPGKGIAREGIIATSMDDLLNKVTDRTSALNQAVSTIRATPENIGKKVDLSDTLQPLREVYNKLNKDPRTHSAAIQQIEDNLYDLTASKLKDISISDAYNIKERVSRMQNWNISSESAKDIAKSIRQVYHKIDSKIDNAIPELQELNSRMADLISARQAITNRIESLQKQEPLTWSKLLDLPFAAAKSTIAKTTLGRLLAKQYKSVKK